MNEHILVLIYVTAEDAHVLVVLQGDQGRGEASPRHAKTVHAKDRTDAHLGNVLYQRGGT